MTNTPQENPVCSDCLLKIDTGTIPVMRLIGEVGKVLHVTELGEISTKAYIHEVKLYQCPDCKKVTLQ
jgi:hypothetical protein